MKNFLVIIINFLARRVIAKHQPKIIGITGSVGKTSTKEAIYCVLKKHYDVWASASSYNNEFGLPLTVLGLSSPGKSLFKWLGVLVKGLARIVSSKYPKILVLEMGADRTNDIKKLLDVSGTLEVAVLTDIGISHLENYPNMQALIDEKLSILKGLGKNGLAVVNYDNDHIKQNLINFKGDKISYGFKPDAQIQATDFKLVKRDQEFGINFKVHHKGTVVPFFIPNTLGIPTAYAALAAAAVGLHFGINLVSVSEALHGFIGQPGRLRLIPGIKKTLIIDDTYNAAPASTVAALQVLKDVASARKVVVLGEMAELGEKNEEGHRQVAVKIQEVDAQVVFLIGDKTKIIQDELINRHYTGSVHWFPTSDAACIPVQNKIIEGDTILIKGSQSARAEKVVKEIMADPLNAEKLLVRQSSSWLKK